MAKKRTSLKEARGGHQHRDLDALLGKVGGEDKTEDRVQISVRLNKSARDTLKKKMIDFDISLQSLIETVVMQFNDDDKALVDWVRQHVPRND